MLSNIFENKGNLYFGLSNNHNGIGYNATIHFPTTLTPIHIHPLFSLILNLQTF